MKLAFARVTYPDWQWGKRPIEEEYWRAEFIETFGMAYAYCAIGEYDPPYYWGYEYEPTLQQHRQACQVIRRAAEIDRAEKARRSSIARSR
jgi:hypothetical protein